LKGKEEERLRKEGRKDNEGKPRRKTMMKKCRKEGTQEVKNGRKNDRQKKGGKDEAK
jgi:hypothetical protein